jgi:putative DNA primase/helicase
MFKGYVRTNGKKSVERFKNSTPEDLRTIDECRTLRSYAGVLAAETVLIDVDTHEQADKLFKIVQELNLKCLVRETDHGKHFYFKNNGAECFKKCWTEVKSVLGITIDVKTGATNAISILKKDGKERAVIYDTEEYQEVPFWLEVIKTDFDLLNCKEGEGRNDKLFRYILPLQSAGYNRSQIKEALTIINQYIFDEPLSDNELEVITRDEAFEHSIPEFYDGKKFLHNRLGDFLINELHIKRIFNKIHTYKNGYYVEGNSVIERQMLELIPDLKKAQRTEVLEYINSWISNNAPMIDAQYIAFKNGVLDIETGELLPFDPKYTITNFIDYNYNSNAYSELVDNTLNKLACNDKQIRTLLEEMTGYCFYRRNELRKAFILTGDKSNGKSTFIAMIQHMLGEDNYTSLDLKELSDKNKPAELFGKLANLGDDINDEFIADTSVFKKFVTGDSVMVERKYDHPFKIKPYAKFIFSANNLPRTRDKTGAVLDRLIIIPFNATFSKDDPDYRPYIKYELQEDDCIEYLIKLGVDALRNVLNRKEFTTSSKVEEQLKEYNELNNPILMFFDGVNVNEIVRESVDHWYNLYHDFCLENGINEFSKIEFSRQIKKQYPVEVVRTRINGKRVRMFKECL